MFLWKLFHVHGWYSFVRVCSHEKYIALNDMNIMEDPLNVYSAPLCSSLTISSHRHRCQRCRICAANEYEYVYLKYIIETDNIWFYMYMFKWHVIPAIFKYYPRAVTFNLTTNIMSKILHDITTVFC